ncbi:TonB-dependent receptor plug domain-containing protein [Roseateles sp. PN1]|uniref:TonB-dependent receptor plug domain-containing protein n=1 Tax=Roseateles sp. PN1 TaxID=3137372 RepID=UPI0031391A5B
MLKLSPLTHRLALLGLGAHLALLGSAALAQAQDGAQKIERVEVTGSRIKRISDEGSLPVQVITSVQMERAGIVTAEQLLATLTSNGNGLDNMASQSDVVAGSSRGNNGASFANLRGQGSENTLVLLNGRRVAAHGLNGTAVNLNTIPMSAVERVEVLKDGASAIYGTDAIGGVINFILKRDFTGLEFQASADATQQGGGNIYRVAATGGIGNLATDGYNAMFALTRTENKILSGSDRSFVNTFQPDRGLAVDTRGTPTGTVFTSTAGTFPDNILGKGSGPKLPGGTQAYNGINVLNLPGAAGCQTMANSAAYDAALWATPSAAYGCAWDTGVAATLQQPVENNNLVARVSKTLGEHLLTAEFVAAKVHSAKSFSNSQLSTSGTNKYLYPSTGASYDKVFNSIAAVFPSIAANKGKPIAFRWRCMPCGAREIETETESSRFFIGLDGPLPFADWDYKTGISAASSEDSSKLGNGYYYRQGLIAAFDSGKLNPFAMPGEAQTAAGLAALEEATARGLKLYGGKFKVTQLDASATGPLFKLPAGTVMGAFGIDLRRETYRFGGIDGAPSSDKYTDLNIPNAPFDSSNSVTGATRDVKAAYGEVMIPVLKQLEVTAALRTDDYTGFGRSTNPKISARFTPSSALLFRGSYSTGFKVPTFSQALNGATISPYAGKDLVDPAKCASLVVSASNPACAAVTPDIISGGNAALAPETSKQYSFGFVLAPMQDLTLGADWWSIERSGAIRTPGMSELLKNYTRFSDRFSRNAAGDLVAIDQRWFNAGGGKTQGVDVSAAWAGTMLEGKWVASLEGSYLIEKKSRISDTDPWGPSELGKFNRYSDPGIRWKHVASFSYAKGDWVGSLTQRFTGGYEDAVLPGVANGTVKPANWVKDVKSYSTFDTSVTYSGFKSLRLTAGVKNLLNTDPPFSTYYDADLGSGSSWDPRVADPRGRAFTLLANYTFK